MPHSISKPASGGSGFRAADHLGELVVFVGCSLEADIDTTFGSTNAARVEITVPLDGENAGEVYYDSLIFGKALVPSLANAQGPIVVGRMAQGEAKAGQNPPYILTDPTEEEEKTVLKWLNENIGTDTRGNYIVLADEKPF